MYTQLALLACLSSICLALDEKTAISYDGCATKDQVSLVFPKTTSKTIETVLKDVDTNFPVSFFVTPTDLANPKIRNLLQTANKSGLHTFGYQFDETLAGKINTVKKEVIEETIKKAKTEHQKVFGHALTHILVPSNAKAAVRTIIAQHAYPVVPNVNSAEIDLQNAKTASLGKGYVVAVNPTQEGNAVDVANYYHLSNLNIVPLTTCLPLKLSKKALVDNKLIEDGEEMGESEEEETPEGGEKPEKGNSKTPTDGKEAVSEKPTTEQQTSTEEPKKEGWFSWPVVVIGGLVIVGIILAVIFFRRS